jgi:lauroyl/myristoyl acyltransferase
MSSINLIERIRWLCLGKCIAGLFALVWPLIARLEASHARRCAEWIGNIYYWLDFDWRSTALKQHYVAERTRAALEEISGSQPSTAILKKLLRERFVCSAHEELEGHWLASNLPAECSCSFINDRPLRDYLAKGKGAVLLTFHFDATLMGVAQLGRSGLPINLMTSDVVEDERVEKSVQKYFAKKYQGISRYLAGGRAMHVETHLKSFYSGIRRGICTVILGEAPTSNVEEAIEVRLFKHYRAVAPGAIRLAEKMNVPIAAFVCLRHGDTLYEVTFSPLFFPDAHTRHGSSIQPLFDFLTEQVSRYPGRWWAADQLPNFIRTRP